MSIDFLPVPALIEAVDRSVHDNHLFTFRLSRPLEVVPGQFLELSLTGAGAFPVSSAAFGSHDRFVACIRKAGRVTAALYRHSIGAEVGLRGPFGNGFPLDEFWGRDVLLVAGGLGMAPLRGLLQALLSRRKAVGEIMLLYGSREPEALLFRDELEGLAARGLLRLRFSVDFATELPWSRGSFVCKVGLVPELLENLAFVPQKTTAAVCGPPGLYQCVPEELAALGIAPERIFLTLERRMKCGVGQCCHCVTAGTYICREGPVFSLEKLRTMEGAL
jgi:NAD(P)H-flavin reductase